MFSLGCTGEANNKNYAAIVIAETSALLAGVTLVVFGMLYMNASPDLSKIVLGVGGGLLGLTALSEIYFLATKDKKE